MMCFRRIALALALIAAVLPSPSRAGSPLVVVELFVSQACGKCPPAAELLGAVAREPGVLALTEHVDYWDFTGWRDTYAILATTGRQRDYARKMKVRYVYTPQVVVDGGMHAVGDDMASIRTLIANAAQAPKLTLAMRAADGGGVRIDLPAGTRSGPPADVWLAVFDDHGAVAVRGGENKGLDFVSTNVVRRLLRIGQWTGAAATLRVADGDIGARGHDGCAVVVQEPDGGPVLGAARLALATR